jgi:predicted phosphodiesterase
VKILKRALPVGARVVCFSDVHGNVPALEAVLETAPLARADLVLVHGDVVNRGPRSDAVWGMIADARDERWIVTAGNHERYVYTHHTDPANVAQGLMARVHQTSRFAFEQLGSRVTEIVGLADGVSLDVDGLGEARVVHASMEGDEAGLDPGTPGETAAARVGAPCEVLVVGHIHQRLDFRVGSTRVVNAGSVGSSCDGVRAAGWVELEATPHGWKVDLRRVAYDVDAAARDIHASGFLEGGGPVAALVAREWELAAPVVRPWFRRELSRVRAGEVELEASVRSFLDAHRHRPPAPRFEALMSAAV